MYFFLPLFAHPTLLPPLPFLFLPQMDRMNFLSFLLLCLTSVATGNKGQFLIVFTVNCVKSVEVMVRHGNMLASDRTVAVVHRHAVHHVSQLDIPSVSYINCKLETHAFCVFMTQ